MRIFIMYRAGGAITSTIKVNVMAAELTHPFGHLEKGEAVLEVPATPELQALYAHQISQAYHVDVHGQRLVKNAWFD